MEANLNGRFALVTGAAKGMGAAFVNALAERGAKVAAVGRSSASLDDLRKRMGKTGNVIFEVADVSDRAAISALARNVEKNFGRLDILIGNAAILGNRVALSQTDLEDFDNVLKVNLTANIALIRYFHPLLMKSEAPKAIFMTAASARYPKASGSAYSVAKAGLEAMVRMYAAENSKTALCVTAFNPGATRTTMRAAVAPDEDPMTLDTPDQVAQAMVSLCRPEVKESGKLYSYPKKAFIDFAE